MCFQDVYFLDRILTFTPLSERFQAVDNPIPPPPSMKAHGDVDLGFYSGVGAPKEILFEEGNALLVDRCHVIIPVHVDICLKWVVFYQSL